MFTISCPPKVIWLGRKGENEFRTIEVEASEWLRDYPNGTVSVVYHRPDGVIYLPEVVTNNNVTSWLVTATDTAISGKGEVEYRITDGEIIGKSVKIPTMVSAAINATTDSPEPPPEDWTATAAEILGMIGDLDSLDTEAKNNLVAAINEAFNSGGGGGTSDHRQLTHRDDANQHPMSAITGLVAALNGKQPSGDYATTQELDALADIVDGKLSDAPSDGKQYARQDGEWTEVQSASGDAKAIGRACYNLLAKAVYTEDVTVLMSALWALVGANLVSISAVFTQGATIVYPTTSLNALKSMLVVTATYDDSTTAAVYDYTLSGVLAEGTSTITATYNGKTATFTVNVTAEPIIPVLNYITAVYTQSGEVYETTALDDLKAGLVVTAHWTDESTYAVASNDYTLSGTLAVGTSAITVSYEGKTTTFNVTVSEIPVVAYTITNNLTNCSNSNNAISINEGESYSATITADEGYTLDSVVCTMGGVSQSVVDGVINIASVTGNIVITASAVVPTPSTQYALHNTGGTDARFYIGKKIDDFDTVQMTFEMPTFTGNKVFFNRFTQTSGWSGIQDGAFFKMTSDKTVDEILGQGKVTANFVITEGYQGYEYYTGFVTSSFNPEYTLYEIKLLKNGEVTYDWKPTATVGEMYDSVTQTTRNFTSTNGLTVSEVNA